MNSAKHKFCLTLLVALFYPGVLRVLWGSKQDMLVLTSINLALVLLFVASMIVVKVLAGRLAAFWIPLMTLSALAAWWTAAYLLVPGSSFKSVLPVIVAVSLLSPAAVGIMTYYLRVMKP